MTLAEILREEGKNEGRIQGLKEGLEQGLEKGMEVGAKNRALEVARKAVHEGVELPLIAKLTGLTKKEVEKLAKELNN